MEEPVQKLRTGYEWPDNEPFPLTPAEAYWIRKGWRVLPKSAPDLAVYNTMPGHGLEILGGYINLKA